MGKGEIARNEQFLVFQQYFLCNQITFSPFVYIFHIKSLFAVEFEEPKIGISGKRLIKRFHSLSFSPKFCKFESVGQSSVIF